MFESEGSGSMGQTVFAAFPRGLERSTGGTVKGGLERESVAELRYVTAQWDERNPAPARSSHIHTCRSLLKHERPARVCVWCSCVKGTQLVCWRIYFFKKKERKIHENHEQWPKHFLTCRDKLELSTIHLHWCSDSFKESLKFIWLSVSRSWSIPSCLTARSPTPPDLRTPPRLRPEAPVGCCLSTDDKLISRKLFEVTLFYVCWFCSRPLQFLVISNFSRLYFCFIHTHTHTHTHTLFPTAVRQHSAPKLMMLWTYDVFKRVPAESSTAEH